MSDHGFERNQLLCLGLAALLSPGLRLFPSASAKLAGRGAWLSALLSALPLVLYALFLLRFMGSRQDGEGLAELTQRALSPAAGRAALTLFALWLTFYAGFVLRSGAERFITTIYPNSSPGVFIIVMGLVSLAAALGSARSIVRTAKSVLPVVLGVLLPVLIAGLFSLDSSDLWPLSQRDLVPVLRGTVPAFDVVSALLYCMCFLAGSVKKREDDRRCVLLWTLAVCALLAFVSLDVVGAFGAELASALTRPFFSLVRNLVFFRSLERVEALVVALWIFPDFLLCSMLLYASQLCLRLAMGKDARFRGESPADMSEGRAVIWFAATGAIVCAIFLAPTSEKLLLWSEKIIPAASMGVALVLLPAVYGIGKIKGEFNAHF